MEQLLKIPRRNPIMAMSGRYGPEIRITWMLVAAETSVPSLSIFLV
jgi:hypothetical protein